eukprot:gb/GECH01014648.1/.p1 GENE.gb/GECH01014648.1/~~gb/GECH01014648.1/.p1  ORF type:complete len:106 (+),score=6.01 gb/GECH01014648.1/:1-318(+)
MYKICKNSKKKMSCPPNKLMIMTTRSKNASFGTPSTTTNTRFMPIQYVQDLPVLGTPHQDIPVITAGSYILATRAQRSFVNTNTVPEARMAQPQSNATSAKINDP